MRYLAPPKEKVFPWDFSVTYWEEVKVSKQDSPMRELAVELLPVPHLPNIKILYSWSSSISGYYLLEVFNWEKGMKRPPSACAIAVARSQTIDSYMKYPLFS
eukprot:TRINITY_DN7625_c0_g2_i1.p1 TRINITY_DN7625_c0_g2~~TRINITY_DN7625_c0_g2_i1.p1  ORF type:complete len:102 (+),score=24.84 TRINITY_DN7625_c0_g2_i1:93-398(+)